MTDAPDETDQLLAAVLVAAQEDRPAWHRDALCLEHPQVDFFPGQGQPTAPAKAICGRCAVRDECLAYAIEHRLQSGIWGGTSERERRRLRSAESAAA